MFLCSVSNSQLCSSIISGRHLLAAHPRLGFAVSVVIVSASSGVLVSACIWGCPCPLSTYYLHHMVKFHQVCPSFAQRVHFFLSCNFQSKLLQESKKNNFLVSVLRYQELTKLCFTVTVLVAVNCIYDLSRGFTEVPTKVQFSFEFSHHREPFTRDLQKIFGFSTFPDLGNHIMAVWIWQVSTMVILFISVSSVALWLGNKNLIPRIRVLLNLINVMNFGENPCQHNKDGDHQPVCCCCVKFLGLNASVHVTNRQRASICKHFPSKVALASVSITMVTLYASNCLYEHCVNCQDVASTRAEAFMMCDHIARCYWLSLEKARKEQDASVQVPHYGCLCTFYGMFSIPYRIGPYLNRINNKFVL